MNKYLLGQVAAITASSLSFCVNNDMHHDMHQTSQNMDPYEIAQTRMITPPAGPMVKGGVDVLFDADFIYWTSRLQHNHVMRTNSENRSIEEGLESEGESVLSEGGTVRRNNKYSPGFKVGSGLVFDYDGWDLYLQYTWFHNKPKKTTSQSTEERASASINSFVPPFIDASARVGANSAEQTYSLFFNNFDLELGRNFYISKKLQLRPHIGFKGSWYTQRLRTFNYFEDYFAEVSDVEAVAGFDDYTHNDRDKQKYWGIGMRAGLDTSWMFSKNWALFGDFALSAQWCKFTLTKKAVGQALRFSDEDIFIIEETLSFDMTNTSDNFHTLTPIMEFMIGLRYDYYFGGDDYRFRLQAGWENQVWFNQNQFIHGIQSFIHYSNLIFQGLTLNVRFDF